VAPVAVELAVVVVVVVVVAVIVVGGEVAVRSVCLMLLCFFSATPTTRLS